MSGRMPLPPIPTCPQEPWEKLRRRLTGTGVGSNFRFVADPTVATRLSGRGAAVALVALRQDLGTDCALERLGASTSHANCPHGGTRKECARAAMSLDFSGARHVGESAAIANR
jgi:hypothetical protein